MEKVWMHLTQKKKCILLNFNKGIDQPIQKGSFADLLVQEKKSETEVLTKDIKEKKQESDPQEVIKVLEEEPKSVVNKFINLKTNGLKWSSRTKKGEHLPK